MSLRRCDLKYQYRSDVDSIISDFYIPCMTRSAQYYRAVGYFTSGSLALAAKGLSVFIKNGGRMRLIASPVLTEEDIVAIKRGYHERYSIIADAILRSISYADENMIIKERLNFLAWMIAQGQLDIRIAVPKNNSSGIYHEKMGLFLDEEGDIVAFSGSSNESYGGLYYNFEAIDVFCSWKESDKHRVEQKLNSFVRLWDNMTPNLDVLPFPHIALEKIKSYKKERLHAVTDPELLRESITEYKTILNGSEDCVIPDGLKLRDYQEEAIKAWLESGGKGILEMATGTGKTFTALAALSFLKRACSRMAIVVVCPQKQLVEQWSASAKEFGLRPVLGYISKQRWENELNSRITAINIGTISCMSLVTTNNTFISDTMQSSLRKIRVPTVIVFDEVHHIGAPNVREVLPQNFEYRLGLSATPWRWLDEEGNSYLKEYFVNGVVYSYGLEKAIGRYLTPYYYYPHVVKLTDDEREEYYEITNKIAKALVVGEDFKTNDYLRNLLIKRAKILSKAKEKIACLEGILKGSLASKYNIFYCGDAQVDGLRQIDRVLNLLGRKLKMKVHPFTSEESEEERRRILHDFETGRLQGLVAIRCLDEGVDIPATRTAYILASSTNPREFIQRRGRILRLHPSKKYSVIHDFIVIPRGLSELRATDDRVFNIERRLVRKELSRFKEFARLAINGPQAELVLLDVEKAYNLMDV